MSELNSEKKSMATQIRGVLVGAVGKEMANRIMVCSCNILAIDEEQLFDDNFDMFVTRMETVIPSIIGIKPGEAVVKRLWELKHETAA